MRHFSSILIIASVFSMAPGAMAGETVNPSQLREALQDRARTSAKARWELYRAVESYSEHEDERQYMAKKGQRPMRPRNVKSGAVPVSNDSPIDDSLFARFINGKFEVKRQAKAAKKANPVVTCQEELAQVHGKAARAKKVRECKTVAAKYKRWLAKRSADSAQFERERRERERIRRDREEYRRRLELRNRSLTY
jgi:hypothetical protein